MTLFHIYTTGIADYGKIDTIIKEWNTNTFKHVLNHFEGDYTFNVIHSDILDNPNNMFFDIDKEILEENIRTELVSDFELKKINDELYKNVLSITFTTNELDLQSIYDSNIPYIIIDFAHVYTYTNNFNIVYPTYIGSNSDEKYENMCERKIISKLRFFKINKDTNEVISYAHKLIKNFDIPNNIDMEHHPDDMFFNILTQIKKNTMTSLFAIFTDGSLRNVIFNEIDKMFTFDIINDIMENIMNDCDQSYINYVYMKCVDIITCKILSI